MTARARTEGGDAFAAFGDPYYSRIRDLLIESAGIVFDEKRREVLRLHVRDRARARGCATFAEYVEIVTRDRGEELQALWNQVAIHQTEFFRNRPQFEGLRGKVLPEVISVAARSGRKLTLWSAGCSSGEEPYSLAMSVLEELGHDAPRWRIRVVATDIATDILSRAEAGNYDERHMEGVSPQLRARYFEKEGETYTVKPEVRNVVEFSRHNLSIDPPPDLLTADVVFCCNVTIYFTNEALHQAIGTLERALRPGGYLFLGHSESLWRQPHNLELIDLGNTFTYRRAYTPDLANGISILDASTPRSTPATTGKFSRESRPWAEPVSDAEFGVPRASSSTGSIPTVRNASDFQTRERSGRLDADSGSWSPKRETGRLGTESVKPARSIPRDESISDDAPLDHSEIAEIVATAQGHLERGEVDETVGLVKAALTKAPTEAALHFLLGSAEQRLGLHPAALASLGKAIYCDHSFSLAYFYRAIVFEEDGDRAAAAKDYENAVRWLEADREGKWDNYLEAMSHNALLELCRGKLASMRSVRGAGR